MPKRKVKRFSKELVSKVKDWLGDDGCKFFVQVLLKDGDLISTHFREGMSVRNFLREQNECKNWDDIELDDNWIEIVEEAISDGRKTL